MNRTLLLVLSATLLVFSGCYPKPVETPQIVPTVQIARIVPQDVQLYEKARGTTEACDSVDIVARVEGFLQGIYFRDGDVLEQGAPLFLIEQDTYKAALDSHIAVLEAATTEETRAKHDFERGAELIKDHTISQEEYDRRLASYEEARADTKEAKANVVTARLQLDYTQVYAPMSGMISERLVSIGNLVGQAGDRTKLATLKNMDPINVYFDMTDVQFNNLLDELEHFFNENDAPKPAAPAPTTRVEPPSVLQNVVFQQPETPAEQPPATPTTPVSETTEVAEAPASTVPAAPEMGTAVVPFGSTKIGGTVPPVTELPKMEQIADAKRSPLLERARKMGRPIPFEIALPSGQVGGDLNYAFKGTIDYTDNTISSETAKITIRGSIANPDYRIFPGQVVYVRIPHAVRKNAVVIREEAVLTDLSLKYVLLVDDKNIVRKRIVELGDKPDTATVIVENGLRPGDAYIVRGLQKAKIDQEVKTEMRDEK